MELKISTDLPILSLMSDLNTFTQLTRLMLDIQMLEYRFVKLVK